MELVEHDGISLEQAHSGSMDSRAAIHAPYKPGWARAAIPSEGSGGTLVPQLIFDTSGTPITVTIRTPDSLLVVLNRIERGFGLTRKDVAGASNATRKTLYNWLEGKSEPREASLQRLFMLAKLADDWTAAGYTTNRAEIRRPIVGEQSTLDLLCEDELDAELVLFAGSRLSMIRPPVVLESPFPT